MNRLKEGRLSRKHSPFSFFLFFLSFSLSLLRNNQFKVFPNQTQENLWMDRKRNRLFTICFSAWILGTIQRPINNGLIIFDFQLINSLRSHSITLSTAHSVMVATISFSILLIALNLSVNLSLSTDAQLNGEKEFTVKVGTVNTHETGKVTLTVTNNGSESRLNISLTDRDTDLSRTVENKLSLPFNIDQLDDQIVPSWTSAAERVST